MGDKGLQNKESISVAISGNAGGVTGSNENMSASVNVTVPIIGDAAAPFLD